MGTSNPYNSQLTQQFDPSAANDFIIRTIMGGMHTVMIVQVDAVRPTAGAVGFLDATPMVLEQDTNNLVLGQTPIYNMPYMRIQGGKSAVICDPAEGDIGICLFAERDITNVCETQEPGAAPTKRAFNSADGMYLGGLLNDDPVQWVKFLAGDAGIDISANGPLTLEGDSISLTSTSTIAMQSTGQTSIAASLLVINAPVQFNQGATGNATSAGSYVFESPITAPDFIAPNAKLNTHQHAVSGASTVGEPHN